MKYKDLIKKLQPYAEQEVVILTECYRDIDCVEFYTEDSMNVICRIEQRTIEEITPLPAKFVKV